jgi:hypothetical protein
MNRVKFAVPIIAFLTAAGMLASATASLAEEPPPRVFLNPVKIILDGKSLQRGQIDLLVAIQGGEEHEVSVGVVPKMSAKDVARDIVKELQLALSAKVDVKQNGSEIKLVSPKKKGGVAIHVHFTHWDVLGVGVRITKG